MSHVECPQCRHAKQIHMPPIQTSHPISRLSQLHYCHTEDALYHNFHCLCRPLRHHVASNGPSACSAQLHRHCSDDADPLQYDKYSSGGMGTVHSVGCCCLQCVRHTVLVRHDGHNLTLPDEHSCTKIEHHPTGCCCSHCLCKHPADCTCSMCNVQRVTPAWQQLHRPSQRVLSWSKQF